MHVIVQVQLPRHESAVAGLHGVTASVLAIHLLCTCLLRTFLFSTFLLCICLLHAVLLRTCTLQN